jgi:hypothetical protein
LLLRLAQPKDTVPSKCYSLSLISAKAIPLREIRRPSDDFLLLGSSTTQHSTPPVLYRHLDNPCTSAQRYVRRHALQPSQITDGLDRNATSVKQSDVLKHNNIDAARDPATDDLTNVPQTLPFIDTI